MDRRRRDARSKYTEMHPTENRNPGDRIRRGEYTVLSCETRTDCAKRFLDEAVLRERWVSPQPRSGERGARLAARSEWRGTTKPHRRKVEQASIKSQPSTFLEKVLDEVRV